MDGFGIHEEGHMTLEGQDFIEQYELTKDGKNLEEVLQAVIEKLLVTAINFELILPEYGVVEEVSLNQILASSSEMQMKTSKRLGFKQRNV